MSGIRTAPSENSSDPLVATDTVEGFDYPVVKIAFGAVGEATPVSSQDPQPTIDAGSQAVLQAINSLNDTMLFMLSAMLEKMPSLTAGDRVRCAVTIGETNNELNSVYGGVVTNAVGNSATGATYQRIFEPWNFSDAGSARLYQSIIVN